jgi:hypothetical protein
VQGALSHEREIMKFNTQLVAHKVSPVMFSHHNVEVNILSGHDEGHTVVIDRRSAALNLKHAAQAYLNANPEV